MGIEQSMHVREPGASINKVATNSSFCPSPLKEILKYTNVRNSELQEQFFVAATTKCKKMYNKKEKLLFPAKVIDDSKTAFLLVRYFALLNSQVTDV